MRPYAGQFLPAEQLLSASRLSGGHDHQCRKRTAGLIRVSAVHETNPGRHDLGRQLVVRRPRAQIRPAGGSDRVAVPDPENVRKLRAMRDTSIYRLVLRHLGEAVRENRVGEERRSVRGGVARGSVYHIVEDCEGS